MLRLLLLLAITTLLTSISYAETTSERILLFDCSININKDLSIDVTEIISVYANQHEIPHGIARSLPTNFIDNRGISHAINYKIQEIQVNGVKTPYTIMHAPNLISIDIGDRKTTLTPGIYSYTIQYHVNNAVSLAEKSYQLNWNITGNNWNLLISKAQADVHLPNNTTLSQVTSYTSKTDGTRSNLTIIQPKGSEISFVTSHPLMPKEAFVIDISWLKGNIQLKDGELIKSLLPKANN